MVRRVPGRQTRIRPAASDRRELVRVRDPRDLPVRRAAGPAGRARRHGADHHASRSRRRGPVRRRRLRHRHAAAVDHRPRRRAPAAVERRRARCGSSATARSTTSASCARSSQAQGHRFKTGSDCEVAPPRCTTPRATRFVAAAERHVRLRAVGCAPPPAADRPRPPRHQAAVRAAGQRTAWRSRPRPRRCSRCRAFAPSSTAAALASLPAPGLRRRARTRSSRASASCRRRRCCRGGRRGATSGATGALPADDRHAVPRERSGSSACARGSSARCAMQMVSDVPIGAFLSGGIDSSAVVGLHGARSDRADHDLRDRLRRAARPRRYYNELPYARRGGASCSAPSTTRSSCGPTSSRCCRSCSGTWTSRSPTRPSSRPTSCREFARRDVKVILSGVGGDELFGGYRRYLGGHYAGAVPAGCRAGCERRVALAARRAAEPTATRRC